MARTEARNHAVAWKLLLAAVLEYGGRFGDGALQAAAAEADSADTSDRTEWLDRRANVLLAELNAPIPSMGPNPALGRSLLGIAGSAGVLLGLITGELAAAGSIRLLAIILASVTTWNLLALWRAFPGRQSKSRTGLVQLRRDGGLGDRGWEFDTEPDPFDSVIRRGLRLWVRLYSPRRYRIDIQNAGDWYARLLVGNVRRQAAVAGHFGAIALGLGLILAFWLAAEPPRYSGGDNSLWGAALAIGIVAILPRVGLWEAARRKGLGPDTYRVEVTDSYWRFARQPPNPNDRSTGAASALVDEERIQNALRGFSIDAHGAWLLGCLQAGMIERDILLASEGKRAWRWSSVERKRRWYKQWFDLVKQGVESLGAERDLHPFTELTDSECQEALSVLRRCDNPYASELVLFELACFEAYWPFSMEQREPQGRIGRFLMRFRRKLAPSLGNASRRVFEREVAKILEVDGGFTEEVRGGVRSTHRDFLRSWKRILIAGGAGLLLGSLAMGMAAPIIGGLIGNVMGLTGAAAKSAGLAFLGGGAVAVGGLGMTGGTSLLVGGGALLGLGLGGGVGGMVANRAVASIAAAKAEVFTRLVIWKRHRDRTTLREVLEQVEASRARLNRAIANREEDDGLDKPARGSDDGLDIVDHWLLRNQDWIESRLRSQ